jgi:hypothetical protein
VRCERQVRGETSSLLANIVKTRSDGYSLLQYDMEGRLSAYDKRGFFGS